MKLKLSTLFLIITIYFVGAQDINLVWPLAQTESKQFPTDKYGITPKPMGGSGGRFHYGFDYACKVGTPVLAVADGTIIVCAKGDPILGNYIILRLANGWDFTYGHLKEMWYPRGAKVKQGKIIGLSGNTGYTTGPHLHFQWSQDPMTLFKKSVVPFGPSLPPKDWNFIK